MKASEFKTIIKESVREVIQEELKEILLEAVRAPKTTVVSENTIPINESIMGDMQMGKRGQEELSFTSADAQGGYNPRATPGADLAPGNVGLDQIMGLMKGK